MCHHGYQIAIDFGFVAIDAIADRLPQEQSLALVKRMGFCGCGRLCLDDDLTRSALGAVAADSMAACQRLVLAAIDYAHRTLGCAGLSTLIHELTEGPRATFEPPALSAPGACPRSPPGRTRPRRPRPGTRRGDVARHHRLLHARAQTGLSAAGTRR
ncbi:hypothetical protein CG747_38555 [Streptomyces sp. CB02959]|nr:hypothetical protein CG747_38555 [Streptomyces sp. CB02959]